MKKLGFALAALGLSVSTNVMADAIGVYAGGYYWNIETEGGFSSDSAINDFNFSTEGQLSYYLAFEHPIPLIPNAKIKQSKLKMSGQAFFDDAYFFDKVTYTGNVATSIDVSQTDYILYYEILDNDLVTLDLGLNGKKVSGDFSMNEANVGKTSQDVNGILPMLYGAVKVGLPFTGFSLFADGSFVSIDDHSVYDATGGVSYEFVDNMAVDMSVIVGYRAMSLELQDLDNIYTELTFSGAFAGVEIHF